MSGQIRVSPSVYIPEGVENLTYLTPDTDETYQLVGEEENIDYEVTVENDPEQPGISDGPAIPETFTIVSQTIRYNADGTQVVDVIAQTDDLPGTDSIEVRVTKI